MNRFFIIQSNCPYCMEICGIVEDFNSLLPPDKKIKIIDATWDWSFDINLNPVLNNIDIKGTPTLYLNGTMYEGFSSRVHFYNFLKGYLQAMGDLERKYFDVGEHI